MSEPGGAVDEQVDEPVDEQVDEPADLLLTHPSVVRVREAITARLVTATFVVIDRPTPTDAKVALATRAAAQLGVPVAQVVGALVFTAHHTERDDPTPLLVLTSSAHHVDTLKVAAALDLAHIDRANAEFVWRTTGFAMDSVAPVGHREPMRTVVDVTLARYDTIWAPAGHPRVVFSTTYDELIRMSGGLAAEVV